MSNLISYTSRDFNSIKSDLISAISSMTDIWTSREQSDPGMVLVTLMAALGDMLSFNMDKQSLEFFGKTVTQRKNAQYIFDLVGYKMHWYESAKLKVTISNHSDNKPLDMLFNPSNKTNNQTLSSSIIKTAPTYFILNPNENANNWNKNTVISIPPRISQEFIAVQGSLKSIPFTSSSIDSRNRFYLPVTKVDQNHMWLKDESGTYNWYKVNNINELTDTLPRFEFGVDEYNMPYIEFVPYWKSAFGGEDNTQLKFTLYYLATYGSAGSVTANILNSISNLRANNATFTSIELSESVSISHGTNVHITSETENVPGRDIETPKEAYINSKNIVGTYNSLVTVIDFEKFYRRLGFSNAIVIDGQRAKDINSNVSDFSNHVVSDDCCLPVTKLPENIYEVNKFIDDYNLVDLGDYHNFNKFENYAFYEVNSSKDNTGNIHKIKISDVNYSEIFEFDSNSLEFTIPPYEFGKPNNLDNETYIRRMYMNTEDNINVNYIGSYVSFVYEYKDLNHIHFNFGILEEIEKNESNSSLKLTINCYNKENYIESNSIFNDNELKVVGFILHDLEYELSVESLNLTKYGFSPYTANAYLVWHDFRETDPTDSRIIYAESSPIVVNSNSNSGYMLYKLHDGSVPGTESLVGAQYDSYINSKTVDDLTLNECKLISTELNYPGIRKFPFYIDGKIHLKEPVAPISANLILQKVYTNLRTAFAAGNLTFGKKINFSEVIAVIVGSDDNIEYFDAGANNSSGSLFVYPKETDFDPYETTNVFGYMPYGINISPDYFNAISLQHYEDMIFNNNSYIQWGSTSSGHLSIHENSIKYKSTPSVRPDMLSVEYKDEDKKYIVSVNLTSTENRMTSQALNSIAEFATVTEYKDGEPVLSEWNTTGEFNSDNVEVFTTTVTDYNENWEPVEKEISVVAFAMRLKPTITTNASEIIIVEQQVGVPKQQ